MSLKNSPVAMPSKRITFKKGANGTIYVYYTVRAYRNSHGKPTSDEVSIGKKDGATGNLIPNNRYFEIFHPHPQPASQSQLQPQPQPQAAHQVRCVNHPDPDDVAQTTHHAELQAPVPQKIQSCGNSAVLLEMAKQIGLLATLEQCFPSKWDRILACAFYILCEGNVMMYIEDWFDETKISFTNRMNDVACSRLFASITDEERSTFFSEWIRRRREKEYIAYDVSSISTYSNNIDIAEWGYNRDGDNLPQMNLGMYYGMTSHIPVYYNLYSGSIPDKVYLEFMMTSAKDLGINDVCFVIDRAFVTENNFLCMQKSGFSFITAMPGQRVNFTKLIDENKKNVRKSANRIGKYEIYGLQQPIELYGINLQAHIYYDSEKQVRDEKALYAHIERLQEELNKMSGSKRATQKYKDYFVIDEKTPDAFTFALDTCKIDEKLEQTGFFVLLSNNANLSSTEVLRIYRERDVIEKNFDQFKNRLDFKRMRTHWNKTTDGKMFVGFIALILRSYMQRLMQNNNETKHMTFEKILIELKKIKSVILSDMNETITPMTKIQKTIIAALGMRQENIANA